MKKGDKIICKKTINNLLGQPLFEKGKTYEVLYVDTESITIQVVLNHILYGNEYNSYDLEWVYKNFRV